MLADRKMIQDPHKRNNRQILTFVKSAMLCKKNKSSRTIWTNRMPTFKEIDSPVAVCCLRVQKCVIDESSQKEQDLFLTTLVTRR